MRPPHRFRTAPLASETKSARPFQENRARSRAASRSARCWLPGDLDAVEARARPADARESYRFEPTDGEIRTRHAQAGQAGNCRVFGDADSQCATPSKPAPGVHEKQRSSEVATPSLRVENTPC